MIWFKSRFHGILFNVTKRQQLDMQASGCVWRKLPPRTHKPVLTIQAKVQPPG